MDEAASKLVEILPTYAERAAIARIEGAGLQTAKFDLPPHPTVGEPE
jgi:hypothetical protein